MGIRIGTDSDHGCISTLWISSVTCSEPTTAPPRIDGAPKVITNRASGRTQPVRRLDDRTDLEKGGGTGAYEGQPR